MIFYGLRHGRGMLCKRVRVGKNLAEFLSENQLINPENKRHSAALKRLVKKGVLVKEENCYKMPDSIAESKSCNRCGINDFVIPGISFDSKGLCPICASRHLKKLKSVLPTVTSIKPCKKGKAKSKFDAAVFYTGGKDSTFLLHYLVNIMGLRVLALTWEIPFMSDCAMQSIESARQAFPTVEFESRRADDQLLKKMYRDLMQSAGNPGCLRARQRACTQAARLSGSKSIRSGCGLGIKKAR